MQPLKKDLQDATDSKILLLEQSIGFIGDTMIRVEKKIDKFECQFDKIDTKLEAIRSHSWSQFRWLMGSLGALIGTIVTVVIKGHLG